ncbi:MAG: hypothetical protein IPK76_16460 [Lewinellaceae bacterium]|nr:hypothetical protein [Lewinellaceae bacterium]
MFKRVTVTFVGENGTQNYLKETKTPSNHFSNAALSDSHSFREDRNDAPEPVATHNRGRSDYLTISCDSPVRVGNFHTFAPLLVLKTNYWTAILIFGRGGRA